MANKKNEKGEFDDFTNLYEISKTLRFELIPVGETDRMLKEENVFKVDEDIKIKYQQTKPFFDRIHREFAKEALSVDGILSELEEYLEIFIEWRKDKKVYEKTLNQKEKELRKQVVSAFNVMANKWIEKYGDVNLKKKNVEFLFEEGIFGILKKKYGKEDGSTIITSDTGEVISIFDSWKGFTGYFTKFFETRKNFYKDDGTSTAVATRIVDENLRRFCDNLIVAQRLTEKIDFSEVENNFQIKTQEVLSVAFYNKCLLQDDIDFYNKVIGGETLKTGEKLKGINELVNLYRQKTGEKLPFLKTLDRQILGRKEQFLDEIESEEELFEKLKDFQNVATKKIKVIKSLFGDFVENNESYDLEKVYISKKAFNTISRKWTGETDQFEKLLFESMKSDKPAGLKYNKKENSYKFPDFIAVSYIKNALEKFSGEQGFWKDKYYVELKFEKQAIWKQFLDIFYWEFSSLFKRSFVNKETGEIGEVGCDIFEKKFISLIDDFEYNQKSKILIKDFADSVLSVYQMANYFSLEKKRKWSTEFETDSKFYDDSKIGFRNCFYEDAFEGIVQVYNKLRNYLTKKPFSEEKWKLNFKNPTLAAGWDKNKEKDNSTVILRKDEKYFLAIMKKGNNVIFDDRNKALFSQNLEYGKYEKIVYKFAKDVTLSIPKSTTQIKSVVAHFKNSDEDYQITNGSAVGDFLEPLVVTKRIFELNNKIYSKNNLGKVLYRSELSNDEQKEYVKLFQKEYLVLGGSKDLYREAVKEWIDFCKSFIRVYPSYKYFDFSLLKETLEYNSVDEFYKELNSYGYAISFQDISCDYIEEKNKKGELYLFQIKNKDWNKGSTGMKNLHTLYFESLFSEENIKNNFVTKLNGGAEIFYRPKTSKEKLGEKKIIRNGREVLVVNHKRYSEDKVFFHCPIALNRGKNNVYKFNARINDFLANNPNINVIGVDRGEKHLAYYSVINQKCKIINSGTLNVVGAKVDYHEKLSKRAKEREDGRRDWGQIEDIKNLKKGYVSQVVHKLADLIVEYNAILVFEDLNMRFKQIRGGIEKSIYQQLEKALIDKLNFLVKKGEKDSKSAGHLLKAYQLAAPFESFDRMGKQTGVIFYTQASYTSKIDPVTGWRPNLYLKYSNANDSQKKIARFDRIEFANNRFEFEYDLEKFIDMKEIPENTKWKLCSCVQRYRWDRKLNANKGGYDDLTKNFKKLFESVGIDIKKDIKEQIVKMETKGNEKFFKSFIFLWQLLCQIRNTDEAKSGDDNDFILSPVEPFFDSRKNNGEDLPKNGDDNGAYNIARKGIIILKKMADFHRKNKSCDKLGWKELYISHAEWDNFAQK